jgi:SET domain
LVVAACTLSLCSGGFAAKAAGTGFGAPKNSLVRHETDATPAVQTLRLVLEQNKAVLTGTEIGFDPVTGMRGLYATKNFSKDKVICKIPSDLALAMSDPAAAGDDASTIAHGGANFLTFYKNDPVAADQWAFYLNCLPSVIAKTPDFFTDDELDLLEFPRLVAAAKRRQREIKEVAQKTGIDETELQWATALVSSRAFPIAVAEADDSQLDAGDIALDDRGQVITKAGERKFIRVLVPYIDMANHRSGQPNAKWTLIDPEKDDAWFALTATRNIKAGKEITISYGSQVDSTVELLLNYGFVPSEGNPMDQYMLKKGGDDTIASLDGWTTTVEEDKSMLSMIMAQGDSDSDTLRKILQFRIQLKESYVPSEAN